ncbi:cyclic nucleotide-gated channel alpha-4 [Hyperolius riggenbachi]|uniref:cyclic nucleotide-gated channel alpha-4 n=1 Tax=Hyperolius riggenbachi TaxID=752182 RepID=UPI0035A2A8D8
MVIPITYNWLIIICRSCFTDIQYNYMIIWLCLDYLCDILYIMDIVANFHTGFLKEGILVTDKKQIAYRYLASSKFRWDLLSVLPTDFLYYKFGIHMPAVRVNRFLRTHRLFESFDRMETRVQYPNAFRMCKLIAYIYVVIHWNSCLFFALSRSIGLGTDNWVYPNTSDPDFGRMERQYLYCFFFSTLILTTIGNTPTPVREEEFLFMTADYLIAVLGFATILGSISSVISNVNSADKAFYPDYDQVKLYMKMYKVNRTLKKKVIAWHQHLQINKKLTNENQIMAHLPENLRVEVAVSVHLPTLSKVQIFQHCEKGLLAELVLKLKAQVYSPGEYVCKKGDIGREMYIIKEGKLAVVADDGVTQFAVLGAGNYFGEISILHIKGNTSGNRRTANIKSIGYSDLFCLSKEDLTEVLTEYPDAKSILEEKGREILLKMNKLDEKLADELDAKQQELDNKLFRMERGLEALQTKLARLLAELESSAGKMLQRIKRLEWEINLWETEAAKEKEGVPTEKTEDKPEERIEGHSSEKTEDRSTKRMEGHTSKTEDKPVERMEGHSSEKTEDRSTKRMEGDSSEKTEDKSVERMEAHSSKKTEDKPAERMEGHSSEKMEDKPVERMEAHSSEKTEDKPMERMEGHSSEKTEDKPVERMEAHSSEKTEDKPVERMEAHSSEKTEDKPVERMEAYSSEKTEDKPVERMEAHSSEKTEDKPVERMEGHSSEKTEDKPVKRTKDD